MIVEALFNLVLNLLEFIFGWINLPDFPSSIDAAIDEFIEMVCNAINILAIFIDWQTVVVLIPLTLAVVEFHHIWDMVLFVLRKIPFLNIE